MLIVTVYFDYMQTTTTNMPIHTMIVKQELQNLFQIIVQDITKFIDDKIDTLCTTMDGCQ